MKISYTTLPILTHAAALVIASHSGQLTKRDECWTYANGALLGPRAPSTGCPEGQHAVVQDSQTFCFASWVDNGSDGQPVKTCMPSADDCRALATQIADSTRGSDDVLTRWRSGSGQRSPLDFSSKKGDTCTAIPTSYGTCRFDLYVDKPMADGDTKEYGMLRMDIVSSIVAASRFFPGADPDRPNSEVEMQMYDSTYTMAKLPIEVWRRGRLL